jgi:hypothetical protein
LPVVLGSCGFFSIKAALHLAKGSAQRLGTAEALDDTRSLAHLAERRETEDIRARHLGDTTLPVLIEQGQNHLTGFRIMLLQEALFMIHEGVSTLVAGTDRSTESDVGEQVKLVSPRLG